MRVVVDTGVLLANADEDDHHHQRSVECLAAHAGRLVVPAPVVAETAWMIEAELGPAAEARFITSVADGDLAVIDLTTADYRRSADLVTTYADLGLGLVDASVIVVAENLTITTVATVNHRDFRVVRPRHCPALDLIP